MDWGWRFAPELPTEPGEYLAISFYPGAKPQFIWWSAESIDWRLGARKERVDAWCGPLPKRPTAPPNPHAQVENLFAPPAREVPLRQQRPQRSNRR